MMSGSLGKSAPEDNGLKKKEIILDLLRKMKVENGIISLFRGEAHQALLKQYANQTMEGTESVLHTLKKEKILEIDPSGGGFLWTCVAANLPKKQGAPAKPRKKLELKVKVIKPQPEVIAQSNEPFNGELFREVYAHPRMLASQAAIEATSKELKSTAERVGLSVRRLAEAFLQESSLDQLKELSGKVTTASLAHQSAATKLARLHLERIELPRQVAAELLQKQKKEGL